MTVRGSGLGSDGVGGISTEVSVVGIVVSMVESMVVSMSVSTEEVSCEVITLVIIAGCRVF
jgi:hypothetical protein